MPSLNLTTLQDSVEEKQGSSPSTLQSAFRPTEINFVSYIHIQRMYPAEGQTRALLIIAVTVKKASISEKTIPRRLKRQNQNASRLYFSYVYL